MNERFELIQPSRPRKYKFGDNVYHGLGTITICIPVSAMHFVDIVAEVVSVDIPFLLRLDILTNLKVIVDFSDDVLTSKSDGGWTMNIVRKCVHAYLEWMPSLMYTEKKLRLINWHFYHPETNRIFYFTQARESRCCVRLSEDKRKMQRLDKRTILQVVDRGTKFGAA